MRRHARVRTISRLTARGRVPFRLERIGLSTRFSPWTTSLTVGFGLAVFLLAAWAMTLGNYTISVFDVVRALFGFPASDLDSFIVTSQRLPHIAAAVLVGLALGMSGAIFQALVRNPLASPDIIGVNAGAGVVVVFIIVTGLPSMLIAPGAFLGALAAAAAVYVLAWRQGISGARLVLVGIGVNAIFAALTTLMIVRFPVDRVTLAVWWQSGTFARTGAAEAWTVVAGLAVLVPLATWLTRSANVMSFGDDAARSLGVRVEPARAGLLVIGAALAALTVAAVGPFGFVALISPHIARMLAGNFTAGVLILSGLIGALIVLTAAIVAQHAFAFPVPAGILIAAVGAPYFLYLLARAGRRARA